MSHLHVSSLRNKFVPIEELIRTKLDIFVVSETKNDHSFPTEQFSIVECKVCCKDGNFRLRVVILCE